MKDPTTRRRITRRHVLQGGLGVGALAALGLAGCSNEGRGGAMATSGGPGELPAYIPFDGVPADLTGSDGVSDTMLAYPEDPVTVTDRPPGDGRDVGVFALTHTPVPPALGRNAYWQALHERLGFGLDIALVPSGDFADRFQTAVAGDQLPDLVTVFPESVPGLPGLLAERATDLTDLLAGDAVEQFPFLANIPSESWQATMYGGRIFGVPVPRGAQTSEVLFFRADMLEAEGLAPELGSAEDLHTLCTELTSPAASRWALGHVPMPFIRQMFGIPNGWAEDGGSLTSANEHERQEEALELGRRLVADGLVHPDALSANITQRKTWVVNGTTPLRPDTFSAWSAFSEYPIGEDFRLDVLAPPLADGGGQAAIWRGSPTHNITVISARSADRAEPLLEVLNHLAAPFGSSEHLFKTYGVEGVHHELQGTDPVLTERGRSEIQLSLRYLAEGPWVNYLAGEPDVARAQHDAQSDLVPAAVPDPTEGLYSETASRRGNQIGTALADLETDILQGREPVSAWAEAVATWTSEGGDDIRAELEEALAAAEDR
ncbi:extracellular solute-binding protein [Georgenia alba]|uniref:Extracellular solute-binding protein n=1 Tax=Georgenia alba TaxID=2233858 RepID=A0ABW2Q6X1_9MICO